MKKEISMKFFYMKFFRIPGIMYVFPFFNYLYWIAEGRLFTHKNSSGFLICYAAALIPYFINESRYLLRENQDPYFMNTKKKEFELMAIDLFPTSYNSLYISKTVSWYRFGLFTGIMVMIFGILWFTGVVKDDGTKFFFVVLNLVYFWACKYNSDSKVNIDNKNYNSEIKSSEIAAGIGAVFIPVLVIVAAVAVMAVIGGKLSDDIRKYVENTFFTACLAADAVHIIYTVRLAKKEEEKINADFRARNGEKIIL